MITTSELLLLLSAVSGILLLVGTMVLLWFRRIYIDAQTGQPTEIEIPLIGKFKTQAPTFALIIVAAVLVIYPISRSRQDLIKIEGTVDPGNKPVTVVVVTLPNSLTTLQSAGSFEMPVPLIENACYRVQYIVDGQVVGDRPVKRDEKGVYKVADFRWTTPPSADGIQHVRPTREGVTNEEISRLGIN